MKDDRNEARLLLLLLRRRWDEADQRVREQPIRPDRFVELTRSCEMHPQLHATLAAAGRFDLVGDEVREALDAARRKCQADNAVLLLSLEMALDRLLAAGITPVVLKGVDAISRLGFRFDERTLDDVDLLVDPAQFDATMETLIEAGFEPPPEPKRTHWLRSSYQIPLSSPDPVPIQYEVHWGLGQTGRYMIDPGALLARAAPVDVSGRTVLRLDDHDAVAHHLIHHVQHFFDRRLKWALDLDRLARRPGFSWTTVAERLCEWGGRAAGGMALLHLRKLFPESIPDAALSALPAAAWRRAALAPFLSSHPLDLYRGTRKRSRQLYIAAALLERPSELPRYLFHRATRGRRAGHSTVE